MPEDLTKILADRIEQFCLTRTVLRGAAAHLLGGRGAWNRTWTPDRLGPLPDREYAARSQDRMDLYIGHIRLRLAHRQT
jgi:hypothetical protein